MPEIPRWLIDAAAIVVAVATLGLAVATLILAVATRRLANAAVDESKHIATQADATTKLAETGAAQLDELKKQNTHRPLFLWEQRDLAPMWEPGAETVAPKTGKRVAFRVMLRANNLGGAAYMGDARVRAGEGRITFESPQKLVPTDREYLIAVSFDAVGGKPFRSMAIIDQQIRAWNTGETFTAHVLIALASDWYDTNDPRPTVIPLDREDHVEEDARYWTELHFKDYDETLARSRGR
jgi:hypothetical protein